MFSTAVSCGHNLRCPFTCEDNLVPRARVTLIQRNGQRPLDKGSAGSGNEIAVRCEECEGTFTNKLSFRWIRVNAGSVNETDGEVYRSLRGRRNRGGGGGGGGGARKSEGGPDYAGHAGYVYTEWVSLAMFGKCQEHLLIKKPNTEHLMNLFNY